jgi:hypothetical protein
MTPLWSDELQSLIRPFRTYRRLRTEKPDVTGWRLLARRPLLFLLIFGGFVSLTAAGRLVAFHLLGTALSWMFVPLLQIAGVAAVVGLLARDRSVARSVDLFFIGQTPFYLFFLGLAGVCLFAPDAGLAFRWLFSSGVVFIALVVTILLGTRQTWICFGWGLGLGWWRALIATLIFNVVYAGGIISYFALTNQVQPLLERL